MRWGEGQVSAGATPTYIHVHSPPRQSPLGSLQVHTHGPSLTGTGWHALRYGSLLHALPTRAELCGAPNHHLGPGLDGTQGSPSSCHEAAGGGRKRGVYKRGQLLPTASLPRPGRQAASLSAGSSPREVDRAAGHWPPLTSPPHSSRETSTPTCRAPASKEPTADFPNWPTTYGAGGWAGPVSMPRAAPSGDPKS